MIGFVVGQVDDEQLQAAVEGLNQSELLGQGVDSADTAVGNAPHPAGGLIVDFGGRKHGSVTAPDIGFVQGVRLKKGGK